MIIVFLYVIFHTHIKKHQQKKNLKQTGKYFIIYFIATLCLESFLRNFALEKQVDYILYTKLFVCVCEEFFLLGKYL